MKYEIRNKDRVIGVTELEGGDPPMGFVYGAVEPTDFYVPGIAQGECKIFTCDTNEEIPSESITIDDHSEALSEQCIEVTILVKSAEEYEKFFKHHLEAYEKQFS